MNNAYAWDGLLRHISTELRGNSEYDLDIQSSCEVDGRYDFLKMAGLIEKDFNSALLSDRNGKFKDINEAFYEGMEICALQDQT